MSQLRRLLPLVLCFSLCLTVCVLPVSADDSLQYPTWFDYELTNSDLTFERDVDGVRSTYSLSDFVSFGSETTASFFKTGYGWSFGLLDGTISMDGSSYGFIVKVVFDDIADIVYVPYGNAGTSYSKYYTSVCGVQLGSAASLYLSNDSFYLYDDTDRVFSANVMPNASSSPASGWSRDNVTPVSFSSNSVSFLWMRSGDAELMSVGKSQAYWYMSIGGALTYTGGVDYIEVIADNTSTIISNQEEIISIMESMQGNLESIDETITDTSNQLQDPSSNIWQAAGETISNAVESLFVPSSEDLESVKQGFDDLAKDKLGGAYTAMETVDDTITQVNDKLNNPSAAEGIEFPGIAVPLGGDIGTVVLAEKQMVTLPLQLTAILHPIAGTIVSIICGLGTFNVLKDMVECFFSGYSFAEYLHRRKGGSDE